jgi:hypothetical protein
MCFSDGSGNDAQSLNGGNGGPCKNFGRVDGAGGGGYYGGSGGCVYAYGGGGVHAYGGGGVHAYSGGGGGSSYAEPRTTNASDQRGKAVLGNGQVLVSLKEKMSGWHEYD